MAENSKIEWTDHTFNPWQGCTKVSPGCDNCYAEARLDKRLHVVQWGAGQPRKRTKTWGDPVKWNKAHAQFFAAHGRRQRVFCASLADVFDNEVDPAWRHDLFNLIEATPNLDWLLLTKRPQNIVRMVHEAGCVAGNGMRYLPGHVWLGATAEDQKRANSNVIALLRAKETLGARIAFLSLEPLLGPIKLWRLTELDFQEDAEGAEVYPLRGLYAVPDCDWPGPKLDWIIVGGESGPKARPMHPEWARSLRDQCAAAGVPFMFKQVGDAVPVETDVDTDHGHTVYPLDESIVLPGDRYKLHTSPAGQYFVRVGKKAAGRLLDGTEHNGFPEPAR
jgi:protein gp37